MKTKKILFAICFLSSMLGGTVSTLMAVYLPLAVKDLLRNADTAHFDDIGASISAVFIFGWMTGGLVWGLICDTRGRKTAFIYATLCYGVFTLVTAIAPSWYLVVLSRFFSGFGVGGVLVITTMLIAEAYHGRARAVALGVLSISFPVGIFSAGLINYFIAAWRPAFIVGVIPLALAALAALYFTESGEWQQAKSSRAKILPTLKILFSRQYRTSLLMGSLIFGAALIGLWATFSWLPSWIQGLVHTGSGQKERGISMMLLGGGGLIGGFVSGWIVNSISVRKTLLFFFGISFVLSFFLFNTSTHLTGYTYAGIVILGFFFGVSQGALSVFIPGLFPTALGATATGFCFNAGRFFTGVAVFFIGSLVDSLGGYGHAVFCFSFVFLLGLCVMLFTKTVAYSTAQ